MRRILLIVGALVIAAGLLWPWLAHLPLGRLPGGFVVERPGLRVYLPLTTSILVSILLTLLIRLFRR